ncbi:DUF6221 family protein [Nocardiopsis terrae]|uniref:DUF6221 family protein n=1 Tax=Streptomyces sp. NPDC057554 TaxID=3350538 RepID=UPI0036B8C053
MTVHKEETVMDEMVAWLREVLDGDAEAARMFRRVSLTTEADADLDTDQARDRYLTMVAPEQVLEDVVAKRSVLDLYDDLRARTGGVEGLRNLPHEHMGYPLAELDTAEKMVRALAQGYQYRPGWKTVWGAAE